MNRKLPPIFSFFMIVTFLVTTAFGPGPETFKPPKPELKLSVCYVVNNNVVTGAQFGYQAKNLDEDPYVLQLITPHYPLPFSKPPVGMNSDLIWSATYPFPLKHGDIVWLVTIDKAIGLAMIDKDVKLKEAQKNPCLPPTPPLVVYIPHFDLFLTKAAGGFGQVGPNSSGQMETVYYCTLESSVANAVSVDILADQCLVGDKKGAGVAALPADLTNPTCSAPVMAPTGLGPGSNAPGTWGCDSLLKNIPTALEGVTVNGHRYPLFSSDPTAQKQTLWYVYTHNPWLNP